MAGFTDQLGRHIDLPYHPKRIISLVPSQTELLFYLGLDDQITGLTKYCTRPAEKVAGKTIIGGTKQLDLELIRRLEPDLIIANKEENERTQIETLCNEFPVWISDINNLPEALQMIGSVGSLTNRQVAAKNLDEAISAAFNALLPERLPLSVAYFIWRKPYMVAGTGTFIDDILGRCGLINAFTAGRYPEISAQLLQRADPHVVLLSSEPYPFKEKHIAEFKALLPNAIIKLVDGELFSWYGSRLLLAPAYFKQLVASIVSTKT